MLALDTTRFLYPEDAEVYVDTRFKIKGGSRSCHGSDGQGVGQLGPALNERHFFTQRLQEVGWSGTLEEYVNATIALGRVVATRPLYAGDGVVVMPARSQEVGGTLRPDEIQALTAFVLNWRATVLGEVTFPTLEIPKVRLDAPPGHRTWSRSLRHRRLRSLSYGRQVEREKHRPGT